MILAHGLAAFLAAGLPAAALASGAPPPGALSCSGCHGSHPGHALPALEGASAETIAAALAAYRSGAREGVIMPRIARGFTEAETRAIADWLSRQAQP